MTQPSQIRYVFYFEKILQEKVRMPKAVILEKIEIKNLPSIKNHFRMQARIYCDKNWDEYFCNPEHEIKEKLAKESTMISFEKEKLHLIGDICIYLCHLSAHRKDDKVLGRVQLNTAFL